MNKEMQKAMEEAEARFEKQRNCLHKAKLMRNGWTSELIRGLLEEPDEINNFYGRSGHKYQEHLYRADRVRKAQRLPAFREWQAKIMHSLPRSEAKRKALTERIEAFLARGRTRPRRRADGDPPDHLSGSRETGRVPRLRSGDYCPLCEVGTD